jgi:hypothetical protein
MNKTKVKHLDENDNQISKEEFEESFIKSIKVYDKPIYFDVDQGITAVRRFGVYARSEEEAIEKVKIGEYEAMDIEVLEADEPYVIDADESEVEIINQ